jgi:hypothetical protein
MNTEAGITAAFEYADLHGGAHRADHLREGRRH